MLKKYLQILEESLDKKIEILTAIEEKSKEQAKIIAEDFSFEAVDKNMDEKAALIEKINKLDEGFEAMYSNIKESLDAQKNEYKSEIVAIQNKITRVMEISTSIEAAEARNKASMEAKFSEEHRKNKQKISSVSAAHGYYRSMNKMDNVAPFFMDAKK